MSLFGGDTLSFRQEPSEQDFNPFTATGLDVAQTEISLDILFIVTGNPQGIPMETPE